jgi:hypothetical protein
MRPTKDDDWYEKKHKKERLHFAASLGGIEEIKALLDEGFPINTFDDLGHTPLHCAAIGGHIEAVRYLIKAGADVNAHDEEKIGETPLGTVAANCSFPMAKVLVDAGADPTILGFMCNSALDRSAARKKGEGERVHKLLVDTVKRRASEAPRKAIPVSDLAKILDTLRTSPDADARNGAAWVLHDHHFPEAASHLRAAALHDQEPSVREAAITAIINYPSRSPYEVLAKCLADPSRQVRSTAVFAVFCLAGSKPGMRVASPKLKLLIRQTKARHDKGIVGRQNENLIEDAQDALVLIRQCINDRRRVTVNATRPRGTERRKR